MLTDRPQHQVEPGERQEGVGRAGKSGKCDRGVAISKLERHKCILQYAEMVQSNITIAAVNRAVCLCGIIKGRQS